MSNVSERSKLINYEQTDYDWCQECSRCNGGADVHTLGGLAFQSIFIIAPTVTNALLFASSNQCINGGLTLSNAVTGTALGLGVSFLAIACYLRHRYRLCNVDPVLKDKKLIIQEKCCLSTSMCCSTISVVINVVYLIAANAFCSVNSH
jgi:hypothetical protein